MTRPDYNIILYFVIGATSSFTTAAPASWVVARIIAGTIGGGALGVKGYIEYSRASQEKASAARAEGAALATGTVAIDGATSSATVSKPMDARVTPPVPFKPTQAAGATFGNLVTDQRDAAQKAAIASGTDPAIVRTVDSATFKPLPTATGKWPVDGAKAWVAPVHVAERETT